MLAFFFSSPQFDYVIEIWLRMKNKYFTTLELICFYLFFSVNDELFHVNPERDVLRLSGSAGPPKIV